MTSSIYPSMAIYDKLYEREVTIRRRLEELERMPSERCIINIQTSYLRQDIQAAELVGEINKHALPMALGMAMRLMGQTSRVMHIATISDDEAARRLHFYLNDAQTEERYIAHMAAKRLRGEPT